jgi:hypothetical protein
MTDQYAPPASDLTGPPPRRDAPAGVDSQVLEMVKGSKIWIKLVGFVLILLGGFTAFVGLLMMFGMGAMMATEEEAAMAGAMGVGMGMFYIFMSLFYIAPGIFLLKAGGAAGRLVNELNHQHLVDMLKHQKSFWRFTGIISLLFLLMMVFFVALAILIPVMTQFSQ